MPIENMKSQNVQFRINTHEQEVSEDLCSFVIGVANRAITEAGVFTIGLSGL